MDFFLKNSLSGEREKFVPLVPGEVQMYVCGMTVYDLCHLGHARVFVNFDVVTRFLRAIGWKVNYVRNITDVDDKILRRAAELQVDWRELAQTYVDEMHRDFDCLGMKRPDSEPRATAYIPEMVEMIEQLTAGGHAYRAVNGDYYFRVASFAAYGQLSGRDPDELLAGARVEVSDIKEDPRDFALWKSAQADEPGWDTNIGRGRPGWHIECSAMSKSTLGAHFDIHGGGPDLRFPHHENEIAQSESANGCKYANYWMHAGPLRIDGEKMSKSLGNFFAIREILEKFHPEVVRFFLVSSQYRSPINFGVDGLEEAERSLRRFYYALRDLPGDISPASIAEMEGQADYLKFVSVMADDFNTREAVGVLFNILDRINLAKMSGNLNEASNLARIMRGMAQILGVVQADLASMLQSGEGISAEEVETLIAERAKAKADRNFARADEIRDYLMGQGVQLDDSRAGTSWARR